MYRLDKILFNPLGRTDNPAALRRVADLAERHGARLTLIGVVTEPTRLQRMLHRPGFVEKVVVAEGKSHEKALHRWVTRCSIDAEIVIDVGHSAETTLEHVTSHDYDLLVVTSDEDREDHATIKQLLRECPCPVWVIRPTRARTQRVLAAVNPEPDELDLNRTVLDVAASIARPTNSELHVVHAWELYGESEMRSSGFIHLDPTEIDALLEEERTNRQQALERLLDDCDVNDVPWQVHLTKGAAADVVSRLVAKQRINMLVLGTVARSGLRALALGNTAERVIDEVPCSVIAVKPRPRRPGSSGD